MNKAVFFCLMVTNSALWAGEKEEALPSKPIAVPRKRAASDSLPDSPMPTTICLSYSPQYVGSIDGEQTPYPNLLVFLSANKQTTEGYNRSPRYGTRR